MSSPDRIGHEPDVAKHRWTVIGVAALAVLLIGTFVVIAVAQRLAFKHRRTIDESRSAISVDTRVPRDAPPLQPSFDHDASPRKDLAMLRAGEDRVFAAMGWTIDGATGEPTIPQAIVNAVAARAASRPTTRSEGR